ncbi:FtsQ-type POTRA domain-containing protein [Microbacterium atlanticum]|uniref:FtsQ-type POTRA domain-containing protein n=1 Tax=Microbacterium atlanticum TaxID=2782168 RepID=UPI001887AB49|nr:FtsQ-type POTRA domain-containing protein [Microbacterium atlanticum]
MRRPTPLPQPPVASRAAGEPASRSRPARGRTEAGRGAVAAEGRPVADAETEVEVDTGATATVIPLDGPQPLPPATGAPGGTDRPPAAADARSEDVGFREVWKAARARRRALRAEIRRFTARERRRRAMWAGAAASVLLLALGTLGAAYSPLFAVEQITVVGAEQLDARAVETALEGQLGTPLPLVDESAVKAELVSYPLIETYALEARPPHELVVRIVERTPIGLFETRAGYTLVDAAGVALSTTATPAAGTPLLSIRGGADSDAFAAAGQVMRSLPADIRAQVTEVSATTPDDVTLTLGGSNAQIVWGSAEDSAEKALNLAKMMAARPPAEVSTYDVSSPDVVVVR